MISLDSKTELVCPFPLGDDPIADHSHRCILLHLGSFRLLVLFESSTVCQRTYFVYASKVCCDLTSSSAPTDGDFSEPMDTTHRLHTSRSRYAQPLYVAMN